MDSDSKYWLVMWFMIIAGSVPLILGVIYIENKKIIKMAELGYEKQAIVGNNRPVWQKSTIGERK